MSSKERPVALVTGSATGVGRACVLQFAARGYDVVVNYSRSAKEADETVLKAKSLGANVLLVQCDVSDDARVQEMIEAVKAKFGRLDVLVKPRVNLPRLRHRSIWSRERHAVGRKADRRGLRRPVVEAWGNPVGGRGQAEEMMVGVGPERTQWSRRPGDVGDP